MSCGKGVFIGSCVIFGFRLLGGKYKVMFSKMVDEQLFKLFDDEIQFRGQGF